MNQRIIESSDVIAVYMGKEHVQPEHLTYHKDWNAIIPVIKRLKDELGGTTHWGFFNISKAVMVNDIDTVFNEVAEMILWSNQFRKGIYQQLPTARY
jgi:hypothetical protein